MNLVGIGTDIVDVSRFRTVLARRPAIINRLFNESERAYAASHSDPIPRYAARFAVKEAAMKALGVGLGVARFADIDVGREDSGQLNLTMSGSASAVASEQGVTVWHASASHSDQTAVAVVVALGS